MKPSILIKKYYLNNKKFMELGGSLVTMETKTVYIVVLISVFFRYLTLNPKKHPKKSGWFLDSLSKKNL